METVVLTLIGLTALGYVGRTFWRSLHGKSSCHCSGCSGGDSSCCQNKDDR
jgi:hypothetical protein